MLKILVVFAIIIFPIATSFPSNLNDEDVQSELNDQVSPAISTKNFTIYKKLGNGVCGIVYLVKKNGGSDDGKLYAMKSQNILKFQTFSFPNSFDRLNTELRILGKVRESPWAVTLHYAWREAEWLFIVMDVATGGTVEEKLNNTNPDFITAQRILSETVVAFENIHNVGVTKNDFKYADVLVDTDGHIVIGDFGLGVDNSTSGVKKADWFGFRLALHYEILPPFSNRTKIESSFFESAKGMSDDKIPELKKHPYFDGINWESVAEKRSLAPFEPTEIQISNEIPLDAATLFKCEIDEEYEKKLAEEFPSYFYVAPEHQN